MVRASTFLISMISFTLTALTIANAFFQKKQFYPSVVYITRSSPSMAVMYIQAMVIAYMIFQIIRKLFFGELRVTETEFVLLLFIKSFHWLSEDRVDYMERSPIITLLFHIRMMGLLAFLSAVDSYFISHAYFITLSRGASVQIVFGFEYAILMTMVLHVTIKYILHMNDLRNVHPWENKAVYLLYTELLINLLRCGLYVVFLAVMIRLHTFPLFSIRPFYLAVRAFHKAVNDVILSRRAINAMNNLFPHATEQELLQGDNTCIICREEMTPVSGAKKLPCGHIFHANCLRSWFQRQQSCPTCRTDILTQRVAQSASQAAAPVANGGAAAQNGVPPAPNNGDMPNMFPFMAQFAFPQAHMQNNVSGAQRQSAQETGAESNSVGAGGVFGGFPYVPPPWAPIFAFPPVPTFAGLSDEEVAAMEGNERAAVEARITCLRNISLLLDAAVMQMNQYTSIIQTLDVSHSERMAASAGHANEPNIGGNGSQDANNDTSQDSASSSDTHGGPSTVDGDDSSKTQSSSAFQNNASELTEMRQRRLQKFASAAASDSPNE